MNYMYTCIFNTRAFIGIQLLNFVECLRHKCRCSTVTSSTPVDCCMINRFSDLRIEWFSKLSVGLLSAFIFFVFVVLVIRCHRSEQSCGTLMPADHRAVDSVTAGDLE